MWKPKATFISLHYAYILACAILAFLILLGGGNVKPIDAFFFAFSANTESGLNTIDVKALRIWQQLVLYFFPIVTNLGFVNIAVVIVRLRWFEQKLRKQAPEHLQMHPVTADEEAHKVPTDKTDKRQVVWDSSVPSVESSESTIAANGSAKQPDEDPADSDNGDADAITPIAATFPRTRTNSSAVARAAAGLFVLGGSHTRAATSPTMPRRTAIPIPRTGTMASLSQGVTLGRNSNFKNLTAEDKEILGGIEYRSLKLLLKIVIGYFLGLHLFGALCLAPWAVRPSSYRDFLASEGINPVWWAFYTSQTMISNLGFTLTPTSMIPFRAATWVMLVTTFLAFAGNTCYPIILRLSIWITHKVVSRRSRLQEPLQFLLEHPRRCYTLLFPSRVTWILFGILFALNFVDALFIVVLDLDNSAVNALSPGPRVLAALFQAASSRHTGTASFALAAVNPAVQFSLLVMMYVAVFPVAIAIRASNTYEEQALGQYHLENEPDDSQTPRVYLMNHLRNQLSFDLWYIFAGIFLICISESRRIADPEETAFTVFAIFFEVVSAYGNVGLSLGTMSTNASLSGDFKIFSKLVVCAMMYRGRHRGLPYAVDRAIVLPGEALDRKDDSGLETHRLRYSMKNSLPRFKTI